MQIAGFENKQHCVYEYSQACYEQCEWHAKF